MIGSFVISGLPKSIIDGYVDWGKPHIKGLIKTKLKDMHFTNFYKGNHDVMGKMKGSCEINHYVTPSRYQLCSRYRL